MSKNLPASIVIFFLLAGSVLNSFSQRTVPRRIIRGSDSTTCARYIADDLHGVSAEEFANVTARYRTTHQALFNAYAKGLLDDSPFPNRGYHVDNGFEDARSCWFSLDTLKKFICLMEYYSGMLGISSSSLGIRFFYAVYWADYEREPRFSNRHTLYLTATQSHTSRGEINEDFDPRFSANSGIVQPLHILMRRYNPQTELFIISGDAGTMKKRGRDNVITMNQGDLCPPAKGCNRTLAEIDDSHPIVPLSNIRQ